MALGVLNQMEMFDQKIAAARRIAEQCLNLGERGGFDLAALALIAGAAPALSGMAELSDAALWRHHQFLPVCASWGIRWQSRINL